MTAIYTSLDRTMVVNNPYKSPDEAPDVFEPRAGSQCWRHGDQLVVGRNAVFPNLCARCGRPGELGRVRRIKFYPKDSSARNSIVVGSLVGVCFTLLVVFFWPLNLHLGYAAIPIGVIFLAVSCYFYATSPHPEFLDLQFCVCPKHRLVQYDTKLIGMGYNLLLCAAIVSEKVFFGVGSPMFTVLVPGLAIAWLVKLFNFSPTGIKFEGIDYFIGGCGKAFLKTLPRWPGGYDDD